MTRNTAKISTKHALTRQPQSMAEFEDIMVSVANDRYEREKVAREKGQYKASKFNQLYTQENQELWNHHRPSIANLNTPTYQQTGEFSKNKPPKKRYFCRATRQWRTRTPQEMEYLTNQYNLKAMESSLLATT